MSVVLIATGVLSRTLLAETPTASQVTVVDGVSYSNINSSIRQFRMYYPNGTLPTDRLPIVVYIHGGGWYEGGRGDSTITPSSCTSDDTVACWLADHGYVVYSIDYTLVLKTASGLDLTVSDPNTVTSASYRFQQTDVGSTLLIASTSGGWKPGGYLVTGVRNGAAQLNGSPGTPGVSSRIFTLLDTATLWPVQWQDCKCFFRFLAEQTGRSVPGDAHNIVLMGHSAGGQLVGVTGLSGNDAFAANCEHVSVQYTVKGIVAYNPPTDLVTLYVYEDDKAKVPVRNLLGCVPDYGTCDTKAEGASIVTYVAENLPPYISFSGESDRTVPAANAEEASVAFANLKPPVVSPWIEFGPAYGHLLDLFYYSNCSQGGEPSPCGSAGRAFQIAWPYIRSWTGRK